MLVMQNGRIVFERYANGGMENGRWPIFSGTKNFWGLAALCAVRDGIVRLDDHVADTITEWQNDPLKSQITVRELLNQTSGLDTASFLHRQSIPDRNAVAIRLPILSPAGTRFVYGPSHLQVFCELLRRKLRGRSAIAYLEQNITGPLGLGSLEFKKDKRGNPLPASGFELTAREWARLGELVLGNGDYHGRQIVPASLLREAFAGSSANPTYGLTFWLNRQAPRAREIDIEKELDLPWERADWTDMCICRSAPAQCRPPTPATQRLAHAGAGAMTEAFKALGLHSAMYAIPVLAVLASLVLFAGSRTVETDIRKQEGSHGRE